MKNIVVTGGSGFIGRNLVNFLIKKNFHVINIDSMTYSATKYDLNKINKKKYTFFKADINNQKKVLQILKRFKPKAIFNLAAETHVDRSIDNPKRFISSNVNGVFNLLEAIRNFKKKNKSKIKLIHISTDEVYGDLRSSSSRSKESDPYKPSSPYAASKASADHLIKSYCRTYNFPAIISNCCNNYGPFQFPEKLIPKILYNILSNRPLPIYGKGKNSREWIFVDDHCEALFALYLKGRIGENYNIGSGKNLRNIDLAKKIIKILKNKKIKFGKKVKIKFVKDRPGHDFRYALNCKKISNSLKWKPKNNLNDGLSRTIKWYFENTRFLKSVSRLKFVKRLGLNI
jgi:dTDP-glucose 4,6-dehydratase